MTDAELLLELRTPGNVVCVNGKPCAKCRKPTVIIDGVECDACLGKLPGVINACCGHGEAIPYVQFGDRSIARGARAVSIMDSLRILGELRRAPVGNMEPGHTSAHLMGFSIGLWMNYISKEAAKRVMGAAKSANGGGLVYAHDLPDAVSEVVEQLERQVAIEGCQAVGIGGLHGHYHRGLITFDWYHKPIDGDVCYFCGAEYHIDASGEGSWI